MAFREEVSHCLTYQRTRWVLTREREETEKTYHTGTKLGIHPTTVAIKWPVLRDFHLFANIIQSTITEEWLNVAQRETELITFHKQSSHPTPIDKKSPHAYSAIPLHTSVGLYKAPQEHESPELFPTQDDVQEIQRKVADVPHSNRRRN